MVRRRGGDAERADRGGRIRRRRIGPVEATGDGSDGAPAEAAGPQRRCIVTGRIAPRGTLLRFVIGPDGQVVPDISARLPGRGLWLTASRDIVAAAAARRSFARAARAPVAVPEDLPELVERLLAGRCRDILGLARRAGLAVGVFEKVREALRAGRVGVLVAAADAGEDGRAKLRSLGRDLALVDVLTAAELGAAFGRERLVHAALGPGKLADQLVAEAARLGGFRGGGN